MRIRVIAAALVLAASSAFAQAPADSARAAAPLPPDRWIGVDKAKHFFISGFTYAMSFSLARTTGLDRRPSLAVAVVPTTLVAVGKEVHDRRTTGRFSARDLVADALGAVAYGAILARTVK